MGRLNLMLLTQFLKIYSHALCLLANSVYICQHFCRLQQQLQQQPKEQDKGHGAALVGHVFRLS